MFNVYILDISNAESTNGVDRHISELLLGLSSVLPADRLFHIRFVMGGRTILHREESLPYGTQITLPLPEQFGLVIHKAYWSKQYNEKIYKQLEPYFREKENPVLHIHTLNLIDLAEEIRRHTDARIITHLHCIPWKNLYNEEPEIFNRLYRQYYLKQNYTERYYTGQSEERAYQACDRIITCTQCGVRFLQRVAAVSPEKITVVSNGLADLTLEPPARTFYGRSPARLLFVGTVTPAKGVFFILEALRRVIRSGYAVELLVAGTAPEIYLERIWNQYDDVPVRMLGSLSFDRLQEYYNTSDIGLIGSVQEQNSYVAVEMARAGLPVIATAVI